MSDSPQLKIIFAGTPEFAAHHLQALLEDTEHKIVAVYSQPDRPSGRGKKLSPSPVKALAVDHNIPVIQPQSLKDKEAQAELAKLNADIMVVVAYGLILPQAVLDTPRLGCVNVHGSILPRWRGAAPIQRSIEYGDTVTGVTIMQMDVGLDTGDMLATVECPIQENDTSSTLHDRLCGIGPSALVSTLKQLSNGTAVPVKQTREFEGTVYQYAKKIEKHEAEIDWDLPAEIVQKKIRAFNPFPICYTLLKGERLRIHDAALYPKDVSDLPGKVQIIDGKLIVSCGNHSIQLLSMQLPGKTKISADQFRNGFAHLLDNHLVFRKKH